MKRLLITCFLLFCLQAAAQVKCYKGDFQMSSDLRYRVANNQLYLQTGTFNETEYLFINGQVVFFGRLGDLQNPVYTFKDNVIYKGNSTMVSDQLYTIYDNGIYTGRSTISSDCLFTFRDGKIYRGRSESSFDVLLTCDKTNLSNAELYLLIAAILPY
jgi:hypothetical protein